MFFQLNYDGHVSPPLCGGYCGVSVPARPLTTLSLSAGRIQYSLAGTCCRRRMCDILAPGLPGAFYLCREPLRHPGDVSKTQLTPKLSRPTLLEAPPHAMPVFTSYTSQLGVAGSGTTSRPFLTAPLGDGCRTSAVMTSALNQSAFV